MAVAQQDQPPPISRRAVSHVARSSLLIAVFFGLDKLLGLFRQIVIGRQFGVGAELDVFNAANNLPDLLFALISGGALSVAFIPILSEAMEKDGRQALWAVFSRVANIAFLVTGGLAIMIALFAGPIVSSKIGIAPGFDIERQALVASLMRLNLIATLVFSLSGLVAAGLQANQHFLLPAAAPVMYDVGQIFGALVLAPDRGYSLFGVELPAAGLGIHGLVYGVILGSLLHLGVQIPGLIRFRFRWAPRLGLIDERVRKVARLMAPRILTIGGFQLIFIVQDNLASRLNIGSITGLTYGWLIMQLPETIIATAVGIAILPTLSEQFARGDDQAFESSLNRANRAMIGLTLPAAVLLALVIRPLIAAAFQFGPEGTALVTWTTRAYLLGLVGHSLIEISARAFYARQNARVPLLTRSANAAAFVVLGIVLFQRMGAVGIALSNSLAFSLEAVLLLILLTRVYPGLGVVSRASARVVLGTALAAGAAFLTLQFAPLPDLPRALAASAAGGLVALPFLWPELRSLPDL